MARTSTWKSKTLQWSSTLSKPEAFQHIETLNLPPFAQRSLNTLIQAVPDINFRTLHYTYFIVVILVASAIFWGSASNEDLRYIDCLFMVTSAMTETGLNTINVSVLNTWQQAMLTLLMIFGSYIFISIVVVYARKRAFETRFKDMVQEFKAEHAAKRWKIRANSFARSKFQSSSSTRQPRKPSVSMAQLSSIYSSLSHVGKHRQSSGALADLGHLEDVNTSRRRKSSGAVADLSLGEHARIQADGSNDERNLAGHEDPMDLRPSRSAPAIRFSNLKAFGGENETEHVTSFPAHINDVLDRAVIGRNSSMHVLNATDRTLIGGAEYRAVRLFCWIVPVYFIAFQVFFAVSTALWIGIHDPSVSLPNAQNPWWLGIFLGISAFNNCGLSLLDLSVVPFSENFYIIVMLSFAILIGNIGFPILLRFMLWSMSKVYKLFSFNSEAVDFALAYPRRVYTSMFPSAHTWWLAIAMLTLTAIDWIGSTVLNLTNPAVQSIPANYRIADDYFQSVSIRTAGLSILSISGLTVGNQFLIMMMMYISAYPFAITLRSSNVYEERSLGVFEATEQDLDTGRNLSTTSSVRRNVALGTKRLYFLRTQLSNQLSHDIWWLAIAILFITCIEVGNYNADPKTFAVFNIIFEVVSAYGPVGLSTGLADQAWSLSGEFHTASKLIICAVMLRGRHRGLPVAIDKAIILPGERADRYEKEQWRPSIEDRGVDQRS